MSITTTISRNDLAYVWRFNTELPSKLSPIRLRTPFVSFRLGQTQKSCWWLWFPQQCSAKILNGIFFLQTMLGQETSLNSQIFSCDSNLAAISSILHPLFTNTHCKGNLKSIRISNSTNFIWFKIGAYFWRIFSTTRFLISNISSRQTGHVSTFSWHSLQMTWPLTHW